MIDSHSNSRRFFGTPIFIVLIMLLLLSCGSKAPRSALVKADFSLNLPYDQETSPFERVKVIKTDGSGNFYVLDAEKLVIFKFDSAGNFIKLLGGAGNKCGELGLPSAMDIYNDSLLIVHNRGTIDLLNLDGKCQRFFFIRGFADMSISPTGTVVLNRMSSALDLGFFIETYSLAGRQINTFGPPRGRKYQNRDADFAFTGFLSNSNLVYVPAFLDSIFIYNLDGKIVKRARRAIPNDYVPAPDKPLKFNVEDVYVTDDRIFVLRVDQKKSTKLYTYVKEIAEYDADLNFRRIYELPESITMSIESFALAPWYHKFIVRDNLFIFMVSRPVEHPKVWSELKFGVR